MSGETKKNFAYTGECPQYPICPKIEDGGSSARKQLP